MTPDWQKTAKLLTEGSSTTWEVYLDQIAKDNAPIGRFASPEEIAHFVVFLCSPRASYCVGSTYYVDDASDSRHARGDLPSRLRLQRHRAGPGSRARLVAAPRMF